MSADTTIMESLKLKLKSATKVKLNREKELLVLRNKERAMNDELRSIQFEMDFLQEQLQDLKREMVQARHQIFLIEVCGTSEKIKIRDHINNLNTHSNKFDELFDKDRKEKEAKVEEMIRQQERDDDVKNEQQANEIAAVEAECEAIEQECVVLQKRNNAIMLKLRRKLLDSENIRRKLMKKDEDNFANVHIFQENMV